jgi:hypothetical protein
MAMKGILICLLLLATGCSYKPVPVTVYGPHGASYSAPSLCEALLKCQASEPSCYYNATTVVDAQGNKETDACREVKK